MSKPLIIILLGPPGAGKGSQATLIQEKLRQRKVNLCHLSTGELLRTHIKQGTPLGAEAKTFIDVGQLVPDALMLNMLFERMRQADCKEGCILDGFPRTLFQAEGLEQHLHGQATLRVLNLQIGDERILERLTKRLICEQCQKPYHLLFSPPKKLGICDSCGGKLYQRSDDTEAVVKNRLDVYHSQTQPLIAYFEDKGLLHSVDATAPKETILFQLMNFLTA